MAKDVKEWARTCLACQKSKVSRHIHLRPVGITVPDTRFEHIHIDIVGPLPPSRNYRYLLTMIDRFTRWPEAVPLEDVSAATVVKAFFFGWIARFGAPRLITTDQGSQFEAQLFDALAKLVGTQRYRTTAYHPEANGIVERWHRSFKVALMCHGNTNWMDVLPVVLLGLRTCYKEELDSSVAELVYGTTLRVPGEFFSSEEMASNPRIFVEDFRVIMQKLRPLPTSHHIKPQLFRYKNLYDCSHVFLRKDSVRKLLEQPYTGPHRVIKRLSDRVFTIDIDGRTANVAVERLKPAYLPLPEEPISISNSPASNSMPKVYPGSNAQAKEAVTFAVS